MLAADRGVARDCVQIVQEGPCGQCCIRVDRLSVGRLRNCGASRADAHDGCEKQVPHHSDPQPGPIGCRSMLCGIILCHVLPPTDASLRCRSSQTASATVNVDSTNGFKQSISFACSGLPPDASSNFSPPTVHPAAGPGMTALTLSMKSSAASRRPTSFPLPPGSSVALALCWRGFRSADSAGLHCSPFWAR